MKYWRMAFRYGQGGPEVWPDCYEREIAAISYELNRKRLPDLSNITREEHDKIWKQSGDKNPSGQASLRKFRYEMKRGDIIYVKKGPDIVGKGTIKSDYKYDPTILKGCKVLEGAEWGEHYREVDWVRGFQSFGCVLGADPHTVLELEGTRLNKICSMESKELKKVKIAEAKEGKRYKAETIFRERNRGLIGAKKDNSDYRCEVCKMSFKDTYGIIGEGYIIAHHVNPIGNRKKASKTTLEDIALVCSNCHDMLHRSKPPYDLQELRHFIGQ